MQNYIKINGKKIELSDSQVEDLKRLLNGPIIFRGARANGKTFYVAEKIKNQVKEIRAKAFKEFAEEIKRRLGIIFGFDYDCSTIFYHIDDLVEEKVREG